NMEVGPTPDLSVVVFRYVPTSGDADAFNQAVMDRVLQIGRFFFSTTRIDGKFMLRVCILSFRTHRKMMDEALAILKEQIAQLEREQAVV
ncbi:MAG: hypothetical protein KDD54_02845, partial [Flavobacteriales bacterium]|nr:hypothetical protein [Flavobacteriales bacterium]